MSKFIEQMKNAITDGDDYLLYVSVMGKYGKFMATEEAEVEFAHIFVALHEKWILEEMKCEIIDRVVGCEHKSGRKYNNGFTIDVCPFTGKRTELRIWAGDKTIDHIHIHYIIKVKGDAVLRIKQRKPKENGELPTITSVFGVETKRFWTNLKKLKCIDDKFFTMKNYKHHQLDDECKLSDETFLSYPLKMLHDRPDIFTKISRQYCSWDDETFRQRKMDRQRQWGLDVEADQKKKALLAGGLEKSTHSQKVDHWVSRHYDGVDEEEVCFGVLDYYVGTGKPFDENMIIKDTNLFCASRSLDFKKKFVKSCMTRIK